MLFMEWVRQSPSVTVMAVRLLIGIVVGSALAYFVADYVLMWIPATRKFILSLSREDEEPIQQRHGRATRRPAHVAETAAKEKRRRSA